jgi:integrase
MPVVNLTAQFIRGIRPPKAGRVEYRDKTTPGLTLRIMASGAGSWSYRYRPRQGGKQNERVTFGSLADLSLADARDRAAAVRAAVVDGKNPQLTRRQKREAARNVFTFDKLADRYLEDAKTRKASWKDDEQRLVRVRAEFGDREAASITRREFILFLDDVKREAPVQANRVQSVTNTVFNWAVESELLDANPIAGLKKRAKETASTRTLSDPEIRVLWHVLEHTEETSRDVADALRLLLLVGLRPNEVAGLRQRELVNGERLEIPAERMKARRPHIVPLCPLARGIIEAALARRQAEKGGKGGGVFGSRYLDRDSLARHSLSQALRRVIARLEAPASNDAESASNDAEAIESLRADPPTPHDFRRTVATGMAPLGIAREDRLAVLAHVPADVHGKVYDKYERLREKRIALARWEQHVSDVITGTTTATADILPMRGQR